MGALVSGDPAEGTRRRRRDGSMKGARRDDVVVQTRVISIFRYRDGQQIERWIYPDDMTTWNRTFDD